MGLLDGKTAIVTGAARGIGKAIALKFAAEGANIAFTDLVIDENADKTLVFIHSNGITDDSVALEPLFGKLQEYRLVYIDRSGFGYSDATKTDKDIESIVTELRTALEKVNVKGPYVLVPNGIAGFCRVSCGISNILRFAIIC